VLIDETTVVEFKGVALVVDESDGKVVKEGEEKAANVEA